MKTVVAMMLMVATAGQQMPTQTDESHPLFALSECAADGSCTKFTKSLVLDANWRWTDEDGINCYKGTEWNATLCPDPETCAKACSLEGASYEDTYGVTTKDDTVTLAFSTYDADSNLTSIGSRLYVLDDESTYKTFFLKNKEFVFDVDVSTLGCGLNGALYLVEMTPDGDLGRGANAAGAALGTGYCDAQCPHDIKYVDGEANLLDWMPKPNSSNSGTGRYGTCCFELDIWEANAQAMQTTPHTCSVEGQYRCSNATECGDDDGTADSHRNDGVCDKNGCDFNPSRLGFDSFFGNGSEFKVDTSKPFTVVTQFVTSDGTDSGDLVEIRRYYVQDGDIIDNVKVDFDGDVYDSITDDFCAAKTEEFAGAGDVSSFSDRGGLKAVGDSMDRGLVLVLSLWDDYDVSMIWLDAQDPPAPEYADVPGAHRGPCSVDSGKPWDVEVEQADAYVSFGGIKTGPIGFYAASLSLDDDGDDAVTHCTTDSDCAAATNTLDSTCVIASDNSWTQCISCEPAQFQYECPYFSGAFKTSAEATCGLTCTSAKQATAFAIA